MEYERGFTAVLENTDTTIDNAEPIYVENYTMSGDTEHVESDKRPTVCNFIYSGLWSLAHACIKPTDDVVGRIVLIHCKHGFVLKKGYLIISYTPSEQIEASVILRIDILLPRDANNLLVTMKYASSYLKLLLKRLNISYVVLQTLRTSSRSTASIPT